MRGPKLLLVGVRQALDTVHDRPEHAEPVRAREALEHAQQHIDGFDGRRWSSPMSVFAGAPIMSRGDPPGRGVGVVSPGGTEPGRRARSNL